MSGPDCVGAFIRDDRCRVYVHRRSPTRRLLPGTWDVVGGHVEAGETALAALAREIEEETGWRLRRVESVLADWEWEHAGVVRHERDYLVEVDGDLAAPRLEEGKHDANAWVGPDNLDLMMRDRTDGDRRLRDLVAKACRIRLTKRLRLEPIGREHIHDLRLLPLDPGIAHWYADTWTADMAEEIATRMAGQWESDGVSKWIAYRRDNGELIGRGGMTVATLDGERCLEIGWAVRSVYWRMGYATEIGRAGLAFAAELGADRVMAFTEIHNQASRGVMERLGMTYQKEIRAPGLIDGLDGMHDNAPFALYGIRL